MAPSSRHFSAAYWATLPEPGDRDALALETVVAGGQHVLREVNTAVAGGLGPDQAAAPVEALAGQHALEAVADPLVLAEHEADLAPADADVAGGDVGVGTDVSAQLGHEALAEAHDLVVGLALGVEVRTALAAAHGEGGQGVLEDLLESEELEDPEIDGGVEAETALVGTDGRVELDAETAIDLDLAAVVHPRHAEHEDPLRLDDAFEDPMVEVFRVALEHRHQRLDDLLDGLVELRFTRVLGDHPPHELLGEQLRDLTHGRILLWF